MKTNLLALTALATLLFAALPIARAERLTEKREAASHVIQGVVDAVFERSTEEHKEFIVRIRVERVERGDGVAAGDFFYAYCFQRRDLPNPPPGEGGHRAVPNEGQRIKAFVHRRSGLWEGNYKDWFDVMKDK